MQPTTPTIFDDPSPLARPDESRFAADERLNRGQDQRHGRGGQCSGSRSDGDRHHEAPPVKQCGKAGQGGNPSPDQRRHLIAEMGVGCLDQLNWNGDYTAHKGQQQHDRG